jgi:T-complex protein 1 subunit gamma
MLPVAVLSLAAAERSATLEGVEAGPYKAAGQALEVIPRTLAQNCGANVIRTLTKLRAKHAESPAGSPCPFGINGETGELLLLLLPLLLLLGCAVLWWLE